jgi:predicted nucleotidyltransferase
MQRNGGAVGEESLSRRRGGRGGVTGLAFCCVPRAFSAGFFTGATVVLQKSGTGILPVITGHYRQDADATLRSALLRACWRAIETFMSRTDEIRMYSDEVARRFRPRKIVLFGSHASRRATKDSDVDMLVIMPHKGPAATQAARIRQQVRAPFALDLIVRSPDALQRRLKLGDSFLQAVMNEGKVLYASAR